MRLFLNQASSKYLFYLIVVACATFGLTYYLHPIKPTWLIWSMFLFALMGVEDGFKQRIGRLLLTGSCAIFATFLGTWLAYSLPLLATYLFMLTFLCAYLGQMSSPYFLPLFFINLLALLSAGMVFTHATSTDQTLLIVTGLLVVLLAQVIIWPFFLRDEYDFLTRKAIQHLRSLNREIFSCFLQLEYSQNVYLYECRLHHQKIKFMRSMTSLRQLSVSVTMEKAHEVNAFINKAERMYAVLVDCSQLRRRVTDFTIFEVCSQELKAVSQAIERSLTAMLNCVSQTKFLLTNATLHEKIQQLENINQQVLQVTAREPLVFILFIASLKMLGNEIYASYDLLYLQRKRHR